MTEAAALVAQLKALQDEIRQGVEARRKQIASLLALAERVTAQEEQVKEDHTRVDRQPEPVAALPHRTTGDTSALTAEQVQLLAWAVGNCHMLARRALARTMSAFDREKWEHVLRICEKAGARSQGVLRASLPTELTEGSPLGNPPQPAKGETSTAVENNEAK